jgi:hypothetical protein
VLTHHNDNARTGAQLAESTLSPQSIKAKGGLIVSGSANITGVVNAQPLYVQDVPFQYGTVDLVYVVDSTNTVYSFSVYESPIGCVIFSPCNQLNTVAVSHLEPATDGSTVDPVGIMSTPVIDKVRNLMYVVARASDSSPAPSPYGGLGNAKFILHVLDLWTLADKFPPTAISASVPAQNGVVTFVPIVERQRTALLLNQTGGRSYLSLGFGSMPGALGEGHPVHYQHGWALTYDVTNAPILANAYVSTRDPDPTEPGGIWQGGAGFAADQFGNVFEVFWGDPVYWNGQVYYIGSNDYLKSLPWDSSNGKFTSFTPTNISKSPEPPDEPGNSCGHRSLSLSANGASGAILWLARQGAANCPGVLDAYDPTTPNSPPFFHWSAGPGVYLARFPMATVAGGRVFLINLNVNGGSTLLEFTLP